MATDPWTQHLDLLVALQDDIEKRRRKTRRGKRGSGKGGTK